MSRYVFDTNVVISALLMDKSTPALALKKAENEGKLLHSIPILEEIVTVLSRPKFAKYIDEEDIDRFLAHIYQSWEKVIITDVVTQCRDQKDNKLLELAVSGKADVIVTGDKDLLVLHPFQTIKIITPADFL